MWPLIAATKVVQTAFPPLSENGHSSAASDSAISNSPQVALPHNAEVHAVSTAKAIVHAVANSLGHPLATLVDFPHSQHQRLETLDGEYATPYAQDALLLHESRDNRIPETSSTSASGVPHPTAWDERRRKKCKRLCDSDEKNVLPEYEAKRSRRWPRQQRAIEWLTQAGKDHFDHYMAGLLSSWGLKPSHKGSCLLCPADWAALSPLRVASLFEVGKCPVAATSTRTTTQA
ncbi:hypothetical protein EG329_012517 [Mollisiaceae sp. DMI_Dod_QoI]|nr:hypothetical protein EG329_012517 [Helotiales sp. DMI_Dod_QoI]